MDIRQDDADHNENHDGDGPRKADSSSSGIAGAVIAILVLIVAAGAVFYFISDKGAGIAGGNGGDAATASYEGTVATVNGEEISGDTLAQQINNLRNATSTTAQQFQQLSEERQEAVLLEGIINTRLQVQAAENAGVTVSDEEVETRLQSQIEQIGQDEFENRLDRTGVTRAEVKADLRDQMIVSAYIEQEAGGEITATEQEIQELYGQYSQQLSQQAGTSSGNLPGIEELRPQIEQIVVQQKRQELSSGLLATARENATVEVMLEGVEYPASTENPAAGAPSGQPAATGTQPAPTTPTPTPAQ